jgi:endoglucanase
MKRLLTGLCVAGLTVAPAMAQDAAQSMPPAALASAPASAPETATQSPRLVATLRNEEAWRAYKLKFVSEAGRVVDTANGMVSHSEGQGYGLLLAVAAGDRSTFDGSCRAFLA